MSRMIVLFAVVMAFSAGTRLAAADTPTAGTVKEQLDKFRAERTAALKTFPVAELASADDFAAKAEAALTANNNPAALRFAVEARWQVPFVPRGLPSNVSRILGVGRLRHGDRVNSLAYSPDGNRLASASRDGTVRIWDLGNGREVFVYRGHENEPVVLVKEKDKEKANVFRVPAVAYSPDGKTIASCGATEIHVWDAETGKKLHTLKGHLKDVSALAFSNHDANLLASGGDDKKVFLWDVAKEKTIFNPDDQISNINVIAFSQDDAYLATANHTGDLVVYSPKGDKKAVLSINVSGGSANGVALIEKGAAALVAGSDGKVSLVAGPGGYQKISEGGTVHRFDGHTGAVTALGATTDGQLLVTGGRDRHVHVWDIAARRQIRSFQDHSSTITAIAVRPDGKQAASGDDDGNIKLWPLNTTDEHRPLTESTDSLWSTAVSPDGKTFATAGADRTIRIYDSTSGKLIKPLTGHKSAVTAISYLSADRLVSGAGDRLVKIWDIKDGTARDFVGHSSAVLAIATDEGERIITGSADRSVRAWDAAGKSLWSWTGKSAVCAVAVLKGGKRVAVGTADGMLTILDTAGEAKAVGNVTAHQSGVLGASFSPDGQRLATGGGDGLVKLWTLAADGTPTLLNKFDPPIKGGTGNTTPIVTVSYSTDGKYLAAGGAETVVRIWDVGTASEVRRLRGATDWVTAAAFSPDGHSIISVGVDKKARVFDLGRTEATAPVGHTKAATCVAVSRDGQLIATGSEDLTVKVWDAATGRLKTTLALPASKNQNRIDTLSFVGNDTLVVADKEGRLRWFAIQTAKEQKNIGTNPGFALAVPQDGSRVVLVWQKEEGKTSGFDIFPTTGEPSTLKIDKKISCAALSPDGSWGVAGGEDGVIRIWDLAKRDRIKGDWPILVNAVADIGITPDRKILVAIDVNGTVKIADAELREVTKTIDKAVTGEVKGLVVAPTGKTFCTLSGSGETKAWDMNGKELRTWKLPFAPNAAVFTTDGKKIVTVNTDGTSFVLDMP